MVPIDLWLTNLQREYNRLATLMFTEPLWHAQANRQALDTLNNNLALLCYLCGDQTSAIELCTRAIASYLYLYGSGLSKDSVNSVVQPLINLTRLSRLRGDDDSMLEHIEAFDSFQHDHMNVLGRHVPFDAFNAETMELIATCNLCERLKFYLKAARWSDILQMEGVIGAYKTAVFYKEAKVIALTHTDADAAVDLALLYIADARHEIVKAVFYFRLTLILIEAGEVSEARSCLIRLATICTAGLKGNDFRFCRLASAAASQLAQLGLLGDAGALLSHVADWAAAWNDQPCFIDTYLQLSALDSRLAQTYQQKFEAARGACYYSLLRKHLHLDDLALKGQGRHITIKKMQQLRDSVCSLFESLQTLHIHRPRLVVAGRTNGGRQ